MRLGKFEIGIIELVIVVSLLMYAIDKFAPLLVCK